MPAKANEELHVTNTRGINRLPPEVLLKVLQLYSPRYSKNRFVPIQTSQLFAPLVTFTKVCQLWRGLIRTSTIFWTYIHVFAGDALHGERLAQFLKWQVEHAGGQGLDIYIGYAQGHELDPIFLALTECRHLWASLDIYLPYPSRDAIFDTPSPMPLLKSLRVRTNWVDESTRGTLSLQPLVIQGSDAPLLSEFAFEAFSPLPALDLPWTQLQKVSLVNGLSRREELESVVDSLHLLGSLEELTFEWNGHTFAPRPLHFSQLTCLHLIVDLRLESVEPKMERFVSQLSYISAPALTEFTLRIDNCKAYSLLALEQDKLPAPLSSLFLPRFLPSRGCEEDLVQTLHALPHLKRLWIRRIKPTDVERFAQVLQDKCTLQELVVDGVKF